MKNWINYYYNVIINEIYPFNDNYLIFDNLDNYYYLFLYDKEKMNINYTLSYLNKINFNKTLYFDIINSNNGKVINNYNNKDYALLKIKGLVNVEINLTEILYNINNLKIDNKIINLEDLWSKKIDYLEYQISQLAKDKKEIIDSFSFFVGLAENAISFLNINKIDYKKVSTSLVHNRIYYPNVSLSYYNPLNLIVDYSVRDVAEYIKEKVFLKKDITKDIDYVLKQNFNNEDIKVFYARLMFPSTYFDAIENILLNNYDESILDKYVDSYKEYLFMLQEVYYKINKKNQIMIPSWIKGVR